ncbi:MAG: DUF47 domain-containing protein [Armatimonadota bacterium]|nr:DUF47 domain-containing protein [Armatimonadota bacterium]
MIRLIPRDEKFFDLFEEQAQNVVEGAKALVDLMTDYTNLEQKTLNISRIEHNGDEIAHTIIEKLNKTFITPMDREDIHELTSALDDIIDFVDATVERMSLYKIKAPTEDAVHLAHLILRSAEEVCQAVTELNNFRKSSQLKKHWIEIHRLENEGDRASRAAIARLFECEKDAIEVIKWKEVYEYLETATDKCEDAANIIEGAVLKNT